MIKTVDEHTVSEIIITKRLYEEIHDNIINGIIKKIKGCRKNYRI
ncbi:protein of unknown function [Candidatus Nitrosocosmicus franklandus]|uniref:Uncharacterized protein n=1 Tax=Candidatus Nitrosocosmicus franklandianus TaxID=1798806 RepID=A0A484IEF6_9ARCH|nr:protein of unknown function [Candidatus Nitrosocosmicus franklandus]